MARADLNRAALGNPMQGATGPAALYALQFRLALFGVPGLPPWLDCWQSLGLQQA